MFITLLQPESTRSPGVFHLRPRKGVAFKADRASLIIKRKILKIHGTGGCDSKSNFLLNFSVGKNLKTLPLIKCMDVMIHSPLYTPEVEVPYVLMYGQHF